jgi:hypothetical protein
MASRARRTNNTTQQPARRTSTRIHPPPQQQQEPAASSTSNKDNNDEDNEDDDEDDREQVEGTSADSDNSSVESHPPRRQGKHFLSPSSRGLSFNVQRQLITDIVLNGGLELVRLRDLCNSKPDVYGLQRSKVRRKIQNKVNEWKRLSPSAYIQLLNQLNISISSHQHLSGLINDNKVRRVMIVV